MHQNKERLMKYCYFIIKISLIALFLLTGCVEPTGFMSWTPPPPTILKPELKNMTANRVLNEGETVYVEIGDFTSISINNFLLANYTTIQWYIDGNITQNTDFAYVVYTDDSSPFKDVGTYTLAVTGTHIGGSQTTSIVIDVKKPTVTKPILKNITDDKDLIPNEHVNVSMGASVTISISNFLQANYNSIAWYSSDDSNILGTDSSYAVQTTIPPFNQETSIPLTVKGTNSLGDFNTTTIYIDVVKPDFPKPELWNMNANSNVNENTTIDVSFGSTLTISISNFALAGYHNVKWEIDDELDITTEGASVFTVYTTAPPFGEKKNYKLDVIGIKNDVPKTTTIHINVKEPPEYKWVDHEHAEMIRDWINNNNPITGLQTNQGNTGGNIAWYKQYTGAAITTVYPVDLGIVYDFMKSTNDNDELWPMELYIPPGGSTSYMIYLRYDSYEARIRINDGTNERKDYIFKLGDYDWVDP
jgi:hypothetical protein